MPHGSGNEWIVFAGSGVTQESLIERSHTERRKAETLVMWCGGCGPKHVQEIKRMLKFENA